MNHLGPRLDAGTRAAKLRPAGSVIGAAARLAASIVPGHRLCVPIKKAPAALGRHVGTVAGVFFVPGDGVSELEAVEDDLTVTTSLLVSVVMTAGFSRHHSPLNHPVIIWLCA